MDDENIRGTQQIANKDTISAVSGEKLTCSIFSLLLKIDLYLT